ncbi:hypothetical protein OAD26_00505 [bacterium]|nr:hypothetical protein [bacterium]
MTKTKTSIVHSLVGHSAFVVAALIALFLFLGGAGTASADTLTVVSDTDVDVVGVYNKAGGGSVLVPTSKSAVIAAEPTNYPTVYAIQPSNSVWDNGTDLYFQNTNPGAEWIWETERAEDPATDYSFGEDLYDADASTNGRVVVFEQTFTIAGTPQDSELHISADNGWEVLINGAYLARSSSVVAGWETTDLHEASLDGSDWQKVDHVVVPASALNNGENTITVLAGNEYLATGDGSNQSPAFTADPYSQKNPGAVIFKMDVEYDPDFVYQCGEDFLYLDTVNNTQNDLYLVNQDGSATYKKTYTGNFQWNLAADSDGDVYAFDGTTRKIMQLNPDGTTTEVAQTTLPSGKSGTLTVAPDDIMYIALENDDLYSVAMNGDTDMILDLTGIPVNVNGGDIVVNDENIMTILNISGELWTVDLGVSPINASAVTHLGNIGISEVTGMALIDDVYYVTNKEDDKVYSFTHAVKTAVEVGDFGHNFGGGDAASCAPERLDASIAVEKSAEGYAEPFEVNDGEDVVYTYAVSNTGDLPVLNVVVDDDVCGAATYIDGDTNDDSKLDTDEVWNYSCTQTMDTLGLVKNTVTVTADDPFGDPVTPAEDSLDTTVKATGCTLTQGYWKTHSEHGPAAHPDEMWAEVGGPDAGFFSSGQSYLEVLNTPPKGGNAYYQVAHQYIAAMLNSYNASVPPEVQEALDTATGWFESNGPSDFLKPKGKAGKGWEPPVEKSEMTNVAGILGGYNEGGTEVPHCSDMKLVDSVEVSANNAAGVDSNIDLKDGKSYLLKVSGTAWACSSGNCNIEFDAEYSTSNGTDWVDGVASPYHTYGLNLLDLKVNGDFVDWGIYAAGHTYTYTLVGDGSAISLGIYDLAGSYGNNSGSLQVEIYEL